MLPKTVLIICTIMSNANHRGKKEDKNGSRDTQQLIEFEADLFTI